MSNSPLLSVKNLSIAFGSTKKNKSVVHDISFDVNKNEIVAIVGESGSGKSITSLAIMGLLPRKQAHFKGSIHFKEANILSYTSKQMQGIRGNEIAMIFQEPMSALNPSLTCGFQVFEILKKHTSLTDKEAKKEVIQLFSKVKLPNPKDIFSRYPHQISGGQMQRVVIAMAIACKPKLLIADEPTTALDVTVQKEIIQLLKTLQKETEMGLIFISHDLALVSEIADKVVVLYQGDLIEKGDAFPIFSKKIGPKEEYTKALLDARPSLNKRVKTLPTIASLTDKSYSESIINAQQRAKQHKKIYTQEPLLEVVSLHKEYIQNASWFSKQQIVKAVNNVSFKVFPGETLGLVGESGCGKSTLGKVILKLEKATKGHIYYKGTDITSLSEKEFKGLRKDIQLIFQDPFASLNPRLLIGEAILEVVRVHNIGATKNRKKYVEQLLVDVGLDSSYYNRYPHELSGGQRQRVGIARTIALQPKLIICDESVSALDISVQAQVLNLLNELKEVHGFTYIFISHDLAVVKYMADQLLVMNKGELEEVGDADEIYANPQNQYTKKLIEAIPKGK